MPLQTFTIEELLAAKCGRAIFDDMKYPAKWMTPADLEDLINIAFGRKPSSYDRSEESSFSTVVFHQDFKKFCPNLLKKVIRLF